MAVEGVDEPLQKLDVVTKRRLEQFKDKLDIKNGEKFVAKEKVAGYPERDKVLSDNNLTDELLQKIQNAGDSSFSGMYSALMGKPSIEGVEIDGSKMAEDYHLVSDDSYGTADKAGIVKSGEKFTIGEDGTPTIDFSGLATENDLNEAKQELQEQINGQIGSVYKPKGNIEFESLPEPSKEELGNVYNVTDSFVTNEKFTIGAGKSYPADTDVAIVEPTDGTYKYNALSGIMDLSGYVRSDELEEITAEDIDAMFQ